jgi:hypothetical protein
MAALDVECPLCHLMINHVKIEPLWVRDSPGWELYSCPHCRVPLFGDNERLSAADIRGRIEEVQKQKQPSPLPNRGRANERAGRDCAVTSRVHLICVKYGTLG